MWAAVLGAMMTLGCRDASRALAPSSASVSFTLDAPLCSSIVAAAFFLDGAQIGVDTFRVDLPPNHLTSHDFTVATGTHVLGARLARASGLAQWPDTPDTVVILGAGDRLNRVLPLYCS